MRVQERLGIWIEEESCWRTTFRFPPDSTGLVTCDWKPWGLEHTLVESASCTTEMVKLKKPFELDRSPVPPFVANIAPFVAMPGAFCLDRPPNRVGENGTHCICELDSTTVRSDALGLHAVDLKRIALLLVQSSQIRCNLAPTISPGPRVFSPTPGTGDRSPPVRSASLRSFDFRQVMQSSSRSAR